MAKRNSKLLQKLRWRSAKRLQLRRRCGLGCGRHMLGAGLPFKKHVNHDTAFAMPHEARALHAMQLNYLPPASPDSGNHLSSSSSESFSKRTLKPFAVLRMTVPARLPGNSILLPGCGPAVFLGSSSSSLKLYSVSQPTMLAIWPMMQDKDAPLRIFEQWELGWARS